MNSTQLAIFAAILAEQARMLGMVAENEQRKVLGHSMAYDEQAFAYVAAELDRLSLEARNS